ncbi:embryonic protein UVS.2-like [Hyperolius riggenbachi]|uniref:embryonic protein UVS.2-like n=1 Tax=Hyperolius riggenbachi TaxID=752182 RepID=UPI0035A3705B
MCFSKIPTVTVTSLSFVFFSLVAEKNVQQTPQEEQPHFFNLITESNKAEKNVQQTPQEEQPHFFNLITESNKAEKNVQQTPQEEQPHFFNLITESNKVATVPVREGDIAVVPGRSAIICDGDSCRWPKNQAGLVNVPYDLSTDYSDSDRSVFDKAMQEFATLTCIRFVPHSQEKDYLQIIPDSGCWSYVGRMGNGAQMISLVSGCMTSGSVQHELNHALGFFHEQSRSDRDGYVIINTQNIQPGMATNFKKFNTFNQGLAYDYGSVMHYPSNAFSIDPSLPTIVPTPNASVPIGQRKGISNQDVSKINKLYNCGLCRTLLSESSGSLASSSYPSNYPSASNCLWLIRIPSGQVFLQFSAFDVQSTPGCTSDYLRIYDGASTSSPVLLANVCGSGQLPPMVSSSNVLLLEFASDNSTEATGFMATYSSVSCGAMLTSSEGTFSSPNYPSAYNPNMECSWVITAPPGFVVFVNMTDFRLEVDRKCSNDYVVAYDGPKTTSPQLARYCGSVGQKNFTSKASTVLTQFRSDSSIQLRGFSASYVFVPNKVNGTNA